MTDSFPTRSPSKSNYHEREGKTMGLDMYLNGRKSYWTDWQNPDNNQTEDSFKVTDKTLQLGYWRKHPNLHGFIVNEFAEGVDQCQEIELTETDLVKLIAAVEADQLPNTKGFFFGESFPEDKPPTLIILRRALEWITTKEDRVSRSVIYRASW